jgi:hypothetical protein
MVHREINQSELILSETSQSFTKVLLNLSLVNLLRKVVENFNIYILLSFYPRKGDRGISDIPPRHPRFTKIT